MSEPLPAVPPASAPVPMRAARPADAMPGPGGMTGRLMNLGWGAIGAAPLLTAAILLTPSEKGVGTHQQLGLPPCTFLFLTGFPCPFCGMTTSWTHAAHGQLFASFRTQPMGFALFAIDVILVVWLLGRALAGSTGFRPERLLSLIPPRVYYAGLAATAVAWLYKIVLVRGWLP